MRKLCGGPTTHKGLQPSHLPDASSGTFLKKRPREDDDAAKLWTMIPGIHCQQGRTTIDTQLVIVHTADAAMTVPAVDDAWDTIQRPRERFSGV